MSLSSLENELKLARKKVVTDGYEMSFGEISSLYRQGELVIDPNYQRLFRWEESQKNRFIESLLLGIPVPPVFVFQRATGVWELIDGLQRISTVLELMGLLHDPNGQALEPLTLGGTNLLPSLKDMTWAPKSDKDKKAFTLEMQLEIKRARLRVEILRKESDELAKFELFQRLNTGGSKLSEQEVRNSVVVMLNPKFLNWLTDLTNVASFAALVQLTDEQRKEQQHMELALRFVAYRLRPYTKGLDVNEYLDVAARELAHTSASRLKTEKELLTWTFDVLEQDVGKDTFKKWNGTNFSGKFLISAFDAIAYGVAQNRSKIEALTPVKRKSFLNSKIKGLGELDEFKRNSGMGVRGTTRLTNLLPFGESYFKP